MAWCLVLLTSLRSGRSLQQTPLKGDGSPVHTSVRIVPNGDAGSLHVVGLGAASSLGAASTPSTTRFHESYRTLVKARALEKGARGLADARTDGRRHAADGPGVRRCGPCHRTASQDAGIDAPATTAAPAASSPGASRPSAAALGLSFDAPPAGHTGSADKEQEMSAGNGAHAHAVITLGGCVVPVTGRTRRASPPPRDARHG